LVYGFLGLSETMTRNTQDPRNTKGAAPEAPGSWVLCLFFFSLSWSLVFLLCLIQSSAGESAGRPPAPGARIRGRRSNYGGPGPGIERRPGVAELRHARPARDGGVPYLLTVRWSISNRAAARAARFESIEGRATGG